MGLKIKNSTMNNSNVSIQFLGAAGTVTGSKHLLKTPEKTILVVCTEIASMSAHADQREMLDWMNNFQRKPKKNFLVHGEPQAQDVFRVKIQDELKIEVVIPQLNDEFKLFHVPSNNP